MILLNSTLNELLVSVPILTLSLYVIDFKLIFYMYDILMVLIFGGLQDKVTNN